MGRSSVTWLMTRFVLLVLFVWGGFAGDESTSTLSWLVVSLFALVIGAVVMASLSSAAYNSLAEWSDPYSFTKPFLPISRYPTRFWLFIALIGLSTGLASSVHDIRVEGSINAGSGLYLLAGLAALGAMSPWLWRRSERRGNRKTQQDRINNEGRDNLHK